MILEILGQLSQLAHRHQVGTRPAHSRATVRELGGGHASPRIHTRGQHRTQYRTTSSQLASAVSTSDEDPVRATTPPPPCPQVLQAGRPQAAFCRGDRAPMGGLSARAGSDTPISTRDAFPAFSISGVYRDKGMEVGSGHFIWEEPELCPGRVVDEALMRSIRSAGYSPALYIYS